MIGKVVEKSGIRVQHSEDVWVFIDEREGVCNWIISRVVAVLWIGKCIFFVNFLALLLLILCFKSLLIKMSFQTFELSLFFEQTPRFLQINLFLLYTKDLVLSMFKHTFPMILGLHPILLPFDQLFGLLFQLLLVIQFGLSL